MEGGAGWGLEDGRILKFLTQNVGPSVFCLFGWLVFCYFHVFPINCSVIVGNLQLFEADAWCMIKSVGSEARIIES